jgi:hypothetical protein
MGVIAFSNGGYVFPKIALLIVCIVFPVTSFAGTDNIQAANNQISVQYISTNVDYSETGNGILGSKTGTLDSESGWVPGMAFAISLMTDDWFEKAYFEAGIDYSVGYTRYVGAYQSGGAYGSVVANSGAVLANYNLRYGKGFDLSANLMLTPYAEFGQHVWNRGVNYGEIYTHAYYGLGGLFQYSSSSSLVLSLNAFYGNTLGSNIEVISGSGVTGFSGALGNSPLFKLGLSADYAFEKDFYGKIGIEVSGFKYGISALYPAGSGRVTWEPDSSTRYTTISIGLGHAF